MCDDVIRRDLYSLQYVPDWFFTRDWIDMSCDDYYDDDDNHSWCDWYDKFFEWHESYQKRKAQKASITEELLPIAWHPSRYWDWCMSEDEKKKTQKNYGHKHGLFVSDDRIQKYFDHKRTKK